MRALLAGFVMALAAFAHGAPGLDFAGMDQATAPGDDFFVYANGGWLRETGIPADHGSYGTWDIIRDRTEMQMAAIVQRAAQSTAPAGSDLRLVGDYYAAVMDQDGIEARGLRPLDALRTQINAISDRHELARYLGETLRTDVDVLNATKVVTDNLFGLWIAQDLDHPSRYVPFLLQGGLGMPDRSYYLDAAVKMADIRTTYVNHVASMLVLAGIAKPAARARRIVDLERRIATVHASREATLDVLNGDNRWQRSEFRNRAPGLDWEVFFTAAQLPLGQRDFIVWQPGAVTGIAALVASEPLGAWKDYLLLRAIERRADNLPKAFVDEHFAFYGMTLNGTQEQRARWKRAVAATDKALGDAVGRLYVAHYFSPDAKPRIEAMAEQIRSAFGRRIDRLDWMTPGTKAGAKAKLAAIRVSVGYPEQWRDYAGLKILRDDAYGNAERASWFEYGHQLAKLRHAVDRAEWVMWPQTADAVNLPAMNAINLPAAVLQPPLFDPDGDAAQNYGALGAIIAHEISHSFDDEGARFDASGRLHNWWTDADLAHFTAASDRLATQFSAYQALPDLAVNGRLTLSENIADLAGLLTALDAYHEEAKGRGADAVGAYTGDQRFFLAYAQFHRTKMREPALRIQLLANEHAPGEYRATAVRNVDAWYEAFAVRPGQALYLPPADRVRIW
ncbi:MAG: M13 family metallopeptidase [Steroidobacterales bacterium]